MSSHRDDSNANNNKDSSSNNSNINETDVRKSQEECAALNGKPLKENPIHLGLGAKSIPMTAITGGEWYQEYEQKMLKETGDDTEGRLVSYYTFSENWTTWEMHPSGSEIVMCTKGKFVLLQEQKQEQEQGDKGSKISKIYLNEGEYAINEAGVWHTADCVEGETATVLFITAGKDTKQKERKD